MMPTPRPVGRSRPGAALLASVAGLAAIAASLASEGDASPRAAPFDSPEGRRIGMNSCAARGCHGAVDATDPLAGRVYIPDGASTTWRRYDPHARAFAVLLEPRSVRIAANLKKALGEKPAHEAGLCLACHSTTGPKLPGLPEAAPASDGISCEACHGPAEGWQAKHLDPAWRALPASRKAAEGMTDLGSPSARARTCVGCHVGDRSEGLDMNHDLIAAGHPRLNFEFATYQAAYPKHWLEPHEKAGTVDPKAASDFEARSWAVGQVVTARAALDLVAARALASKDGAARIAPAPEAVWPEFSEYECFACHHDLASPSPRQEDGRPLGQLPWATWATAMLPRLPGATPTLGFAELRAEMARPVPDPDRVAALAGRAKGDLGALLPTVEASTFGQAEVEALLKAVIDDSPDPSTSWDRAAQRDLALEALARASKAAGRAVGPEVDAAIRKGSKALDFPPDSDSPRGGPTGPKPRSNPRPGP